ncbi:unnamed protein product [Echinostoma caproni]|uniref:Uncharacterized protein n=1 Tax=Echinostoma caproni TaxID=27848 RepID=A0A3P8JNM2_9TREM|nr:unnamed protein product [Echinostoma caproni]
MNRGGCEGLLRAARLLARPRFTDAHLGSQSASSSLLFELMTGRDSAVALIAAQILVALALTLEPTLGPEILFELCSCVPANSKSTCVEDNQSGEVKVPCSPQTTPLLLFFPVLDELETGWTARRLSISDSPPTESPWVASELLPNIFDDPIAYQPSTTMGCYLVQEMLTFQFFPRLWDVVSRDSQKSRTAPLLRAVVWLLCREQILVRTRLARPRLQLALRMQLKPLLTLLDSQTEFSERIELLLTLLEHALSIHERVPLQPEANRAGPGGRFTAARKPTRPNTSRYLSPRLAYQLGHCLIRLAARFLSRLRQSTDSNERTNMLRVLGRIENLLQPYGDCYTINPINGGSSALLRSTALRQLSTTESLQLVDPAYECEADLARSDRLSRLRDLDEQLVDTQCIPALTDRSLPSQSSSSSLLLLNPPSASDGTNEDGLTKGYLRAPTLSRLDRRGSVSPYRRPPGAAFNAFGVPDTIGNPDWRCKSEKTTPAEPGMLYAHSPPFRFDAVRSPNWLHWLRLAMQLCAGSPVRHTDSHVTVHVKALATAQQQSLLPHGLHLPQTSVWQLPEQIPLVVSPTGIGLERVIRLMHQFCPQVKKDAGRGPARPSTGTRACESMWLSQSLFGTPLALLVAECSGSYAEQSDPGGENGDAQGHLKFGGTGTTRLPRHLDSIDVFPTVLPGFFHFSIPKTLHFIFPIKLAVDYCQRRVDYQTDLFRFTRHLLMALFVICHKQDCATVAAEQHRSTDTESAYSVKYPPHLPLDRLLYCLNPREMSILLSDVRRNLRLRLAFDWLRHNQKWETCRPRHDRPSTTHPFSVIISRTLDALGGGPIPPAPAFITPGLLLALLQSHLAEPGVARLVGPLLSAARLLQPPADPGPIASETGNADSDVEEIDVNGELVVVLNE